MLNFLSLKRARNSISYNAPRKTRTHKIGNMGLVSHFMVWPFIIGLLVGLFMVYAHVNLPVDKVPKWPHPSNVNDVVYKDRNGLCFMFDVEVMDCGGKSSKPYPYVV